MTVFDVYLNDRKCCRAGVGADGGLTAIVNWVKLKGAAARTARRLNRPVEESRLEVGGLSDRTHRSWLGRNVAIGDRVTIAIGRAGRIDRPLRQRRPGTEARDARSNDVPQRRSRKSLQLLHVDLQRSWDAVHVTDAQVMQTGLNERESKRCCPGTT
jgi:hypothetical protein